MPGPNFLQIEVMIPGDPVPQGRGRVGRWHSKDGREGVTVRDPLKSRNWKAYAKGRMEEALARLGLSSPAFSGPVTVEIEAVFSCPRGDWKKRTLVARRPHTKRGDTDNISKAVKDAANATLWLDDAQVWHETVVKWIGAQGEAPYLKIVAKGDIYESTDGTCQAATSCPSVKDSGLTRRY